MPVCVNVRSDDEALASKRREVAERVIAEFPAHLLANANLLCFFDSEDCRTLRSEFGNANRGVFGPVEREAFCAPPWPHYVFEMVFVDDFPASLEWKQIFHQLIYIHGSTCVTNVGLTMTFAHELQHCIQYLAERKLWATNTTVTRFFPREVLTLAGVKVFHIPIELEARMTSKRIAQKMWGVKAVDEYIETRIKESSTEADLEDWQFVRDLDHSSSCELATDTIKLFKRLTPYKPQIDRMLEELRSNNQFDDLEFGELPFASTLSSE